jgi:hypothetical protein
VANGDDREPVPQPQPPEQPEPYPEPTSPTPDPPISIPYIPFCESEKVKSSHPPIPVDSPPPREPKKE